MNRMSKMPPPPDFEENPEWTEEDFAWVTHRLCDLADELCGGRLVSSLEGGYDLGALAASTAAHVEVLMRRGTG